MSRVPNERRPVKRAAAAVLLTTLLATGSLVIVTRSDSAPKPGVVAIGKPAMYDSRCGDAYRAVRFYRQKYDEHRTLLGYTLAPALEEAMGCKRLRERARYWTHAAKVNRVAAIRWRELEYADPPYPYLQIAICETGGINGGRPLWTHHNGTYSGAYGFAHSTWEYYKYPGYPSPAASATPRQQTRVAMRLVATFGGYSSWPACHRRLGLPG